MIFQNKFILKNYISRNWYNYDTINFIFFIIQIEKNENYNILGCK